MKEKLEYAGKCGAIALAIAYVLGLFISNLYAGMLRFSDFSLIKARYVVTGVCFLSYIAMPIVAWIAAWEVKRAIKRKTFSFLVLFGILLSAIFILPALSQYFISSLRLYGCNVQTLLKTYWLFYFSPMLMLPYILIAIPILVFYHKWKAEPKSPSIAKRGQYLIIALVTMGVAWQTVQYAWRVHPNIEPSIGGGQPALATVILGHSVPRELIEMWVPDKEKVGQPENDCILHFDAMIWSTSESLVYLTPLSPQNQIHGHLPWLEAVALPKSNIDALRYFNGSVTIDTFTGEVSIQVRAPHSFRLTDEIMKQDHWQPDIASPALPIQKGGTRKTTTGPDKE